MGLECLIVTGDPTLLGHFQASLGTHGASLQLRQDSASAIELASRRHLDGLVIDCDDVPGGTKALAQLRSTPASQQTVIIAIVNGSTSSEAALDLGANFVVSKPIHKTRLRSILISSLPRWNANIVGISDTTLICQCAFEILSDNLAPPAWRT